MYRSCLINCVVYLNNEPIHEKYAARPDLGQTRARHRENGYCVCISKGNALPSLRDSPFFGTIPRYPEYLVAISIERVVYCCHKVQLVKRHIWGR